MAAPHKRKRHSSNRSPYTTFTVAAVAVTMLVAIPLAIGLGWFWLLCYLIGVNVAAFVLYAYDKGVAGTGRLRVPERVLFGVQAVGGTAGAFVAQRLFHHKTRKSSFQIVFWLIFGVQAAAIAWWLFGR